MESVSGTSDSDRMFTASGLLPSTSYTFEVAAVSSEGVGTFNTFMPFPTSDTQPCLDTILIVAGVVVVIVLGIFIMSTAVLLRWILKHRLPQKCKV